MPSKLNKTLQRRVNDLLSGEPTAQKLNMALRHLAKWRAGMLEKLLVERSGETVLSGPFRGMNYATRTSEGSRNPRLIGSYEASLSQVIEDIVAAGYHRVIDIGTAEGYYAIGLALRLPQSQVFARDTDEKAQIACANLAAANGVSDRVHIGGAVGHGDLADLVQGRTVIICDIEGAEDILLDPTAAPALRSADILVEVHEGKKAGRVDLLTRRFEPTHDIRRIERHLDDSGLPAWADGLADLDRLLLLWEWRSTPTPWLWMRQRVS